MEATARISVATVQEAYRTTGLVPVIRQTYGGGKACALAAVAASRSFTECGERWNCWTLAAYLGLGQDYASGFVGGFDGRERMDVGGDYHTGYADGEPVRRAVFSLPDVWV